MWHMNGWFPYMLIYPLLFAGLLALGVVWMVRVLRPDQPPSDTPQRILAERYARGELTDDEYRSRLTTLRKG
jgi:putative membrane protein